MPYPNTTLIWLLLDQEKYPQVFQELSKSHDFYTIDNYAKQLPKLPELQRPLANVYLSLIPSFLSEKIGRKYYRVANRYLRKANKLGAEVESEALRAELMITYKNRPSLLEEFER